MILQKFSLDTFFFLCYLCTLLKIFISLSLIIISVLVPLNLVHEKNASDEVQDLNRLSWVNIRTAHISFYWAHLIMILIVIIFVCCTLYTELMKYICIWQTYLSLSQHCLQAFTNAILVMNISERFLSVFTLFCLYSIFSGRVCTIWINWDLSELSKKVLKWRTIVCILKTAEIKLLRSVINFLSDWNCHDLIKDEMSTIYIWSEKSLWRQYLDKNNQNYMCLSIFNLIWMPSISFVRRKVDTIYHCWQKMAHLNKKIDQNQQKYEKYLSLISAFIQFNT